MIEFSRSIAFFIQRCRQNVEKANSAIGVYMSTKTDYSYLKGFVKQFYFDFTRTCLRILPPHIGHDTANLSHELKTPLQSIIGSAELLENGIVKPEDTKDFIGNIRKEALRLVLLIDDIIRLSQLDEGGKPATEPVNIYDIAGEVLDALTPSADKQNIQLELDGEHYEINSIGRYIYEIIYNLCDNAIRYNKPGAR